MVQFQSVGDRSHEQLISYGVCVPPPTSDREPSIPTPPAVTTPSPHPTVLNIDVLHEPITDRTAPAEVGVHAGWLTFHALLGLDLHHGGPATPHDQKAS